MNEQQFLKTMIEVVKHDDYEKKDDLLGILRHSFIKFDKSSAFTQKTGQFEEYIDLRVPFLCYRKRKI